MSALVIIPVDFTDPALALYLKRGFQNGNAFGDCESTAFSRFLHLDL